MQVGHWIFCGFFCRAKGREGRRSGLNLRGGKGSTRSLDAIWSWRPNQHPQRRGRQAGEHQYSEVPLSIAGNGAVDSMRHLIFRKSCMDTWTAQLWFADFIILWLYWSQRCARGAVVARQVNKLLDFFTGRCYFIVMREILHTVCTQFAHKERQNLQNSAIKRNHPKQQGQRGKPGCFCCKSWNLSVKKGTYAL